MYSTQHIITYHNIIAKIMASGFSRTSYYCRYQIYIHYSAFPTLTTAPIGFHVQVRVSTI